MYVTEAQVERACADALASFPFPGYFDPALGGHRSIVRTVARYLAPGSRLLDFGAGAADKTAPLAAMGYRCTAVDDLSDEWHQRGNARQRIIDYARGVGIEYLASPAEIPPNETFDMLMLHDVLEELHDSPRHLLIDLLSHVREGGFLFVTVPNHVNLRKRLAVLFGRTNNPRFEVFYWYPGQKWRGPVREYSRGDCEALAHALDLEVVELTGAHHMLGQVPSRLRRAYLAASRTMPNTRDTWSMVARKPAGWAPRRDLDGEELRRITGLTSWGEATS
jgi:2-polyprenyl-3-methyl-5-hydroxy-6-metoxy-1,4-benzoquinol methylase